MGERDARTGVLPREGLEIKIDTEREREKEREKEREREREREITTCRLDSEKMSPSSPLDSAECYIGLRRALFSCSFVSNVLTFWNVLHARYLSAAASKKEKQFTVGPVVLAFFLFVVVGSSLLQVH